MKLTAIAILLLAVISISTFNVTAQGQAQKSKTFLSALKEGQSVIVKEVAGRFEINAIEGSHKVIEIGTDYLVVQDIAGITEIRIPIFSIKAITRLKAAGK
jgi:preprotein translocase subunit YajC